MLLFKATIPAIVAAAAAVLWGSLIAATGVEFGAAAWLAGGVIGLATAHAAPDRSRASRTSVMYAIACTVLAKCWFVLCPWGVARPSLIEAFRAIDLLWLAMACSSAHWITSLTHERRARTPVARVSRPLVAPNAFARHARLPRPSEPRPAQGARWNRADRNPARSEGKRTP